MESHEARHTHAMNRLCTAALLTTILLACGPGDGPGDDAGADASEAGDAGLEIAPPDIPWLDDGMPPIAEPMLTPCPEGWHEVIEVDPAGEMDVVTCDPYGTEPGGTEPDVCPEGQAHFTGDPGCTPVGAPCPEGDFPEGLPSDGNVVYVLAGAPPGGDGSETSPLSTITEGLALASRGTIIAIGKGAYDEALRLPAGVTLWGACAAETRLTSSTWGPLAQGVITVPSADTRVANLWVGPADIPGIMAYGDRASLSLDGVIIDGVRRLGLWVTNGSHVDGRELVVSSTRADDAGHFGEGIAVDSASALDLRRAWVSGNREVGVFADGDSTALALSDVVVHDTQAQESSGTRGWGLGVQRGATAMVTRTLLSQNHNLGVFADGEGTLVALSDVVVCDTQAQQSDGAAGRGLGVQEGATATVARTLLARNRDVGMFASDEGTLLTLSDVVIRDTQAQESDGARGRGLNVEAGATATVTRVLLSRNRDVGVLANDHGTSLTVSDVVIRDTQARESDGTAGRGLGVQGGATATVTRALLARNRQLGVLAIGDRTSLTLLDVVVRDTQAQESDGTAGAGSSIQGGAAAAVSRTLLSRNRQVGVLVHGEGTSLTLSDVVIRDTQAQESDGTAGRALNIQRGAMAAVTRALLSGNRDVAVLAHSLGTAVELFDVVMAQTDEQACADTTCSEAPFGIGLVGAGEASLSATRFAVRGGALCGVMVAEDAQVDLAIGEVSSFQIGVCLQVDGYSVSRLTDQVRYVDNGNNLDATSLPVPTVASLID